MIDHAPPRGHPEVVREGTFVAPAWLRNGHAQTIYASCLAPRPRVRWRRERWESPDGDFIDLDWLAASDGATVHARADSDRPTVALFHGLEGSSQSHYARSLMHAV